MHIRHEISVIVLILAGGSISVSILAFLSYQAFEMRRELARRVDLILPGSARLHWRRHRSPNLPSGMDVKVAGGIVPRWEQFEVIKRLGRWGFSPVQALAAFFAVRLVAALLLAVVMFLITRGNVGATSLMLHAIWTLLGAFIGWYGPYSIARAMATMRIKAVESGLPDALELLVVAVEAGLSLEDAIERTLTELSRTQPELSEELSLTLADLKILPSREQAFANFAARVNVPSVRSVVTTLSQTMHYGTPLAQALRSVAEELRTESLYKLEERVNRLPVLMTVPMILFILPAILVIIGGPAFLSVIDAL